MQLGRYRRPLIIGAVVLAAVTVTGLLAASFRFYRYRSCANVLLDAHSAVETLSDARIKRDTIAHIEYLESRLAKGWLFAKRDVFLGRLKAEICRVRDVATGAAHRSMETPGHHVVVTVSNVDGAHMPTSVVVPPDWDGASPLDAVLYLHSGGVDEMIECFPAPAIDSALSFMPLARGSHDYLGVQMVAVEEAVADVRSRYPIKRLFVMGTSMGGMGAWLFAQRHATSIAGVSPWCGNAAPEAWRGVWETERSFATSDAGDAWHRVRQWRTPIHHVNELRTVPQIPIYLAHGTADTKIPVGHSDAMAEALGEGPWLRYDRFDGLPHRLPPMYQERYEWLAARAPNTTLRRTLPNPPLPAPSFATVGRRAVGPACAIFEREFAVIIGETPSAAVTTCAADLRAMWQTRYGGNPRTLPPALLPRDYTSKFPSFVAIGSPKENPCVAKSLHALDVSVTPGHVRLFGHEFKGEDVGLILLRPMTHTLVIWGSTDASYQQLWCRFVNDVDWEGDRGRWWFDYAVYDRKTCSAETFLVVGFLNKNGGFSPEHMFCGSNSLRANAPGCAWPSKPDGVSTNLSQIPPETVDSPRGPVGFDRSAATGPLSIQGTDFARGIGMVPPGSATWKIDGRYASFSATVGLARTGDRFPIRFQQERVRFQIWTDGRLAATTEALSATSGTRELSVNLTGVSRLELRAEPTTTQLWHYGAVGWGSARLSPSN